MNSIFLNQVTSIDTELHIIKNKKIHRHLKSIVKQRIYALILVLLGFIVGCMTGDFTPVLLMFPFVIVLFIAKHSLLIKTN